LVTRIDSTMTPTRPTLNHNQPTQPTNRRNRDVPKLVLADMRGGSMKRYLFEGDVKNSGKIERFLGDFFAGKLKVRNAPNAHFALRLFLVVVVVVPSVRLLMVQQ
jgi:hypothetical protein